MIGQTSANPVAGIATASSMLRLADAHDEATDRNLIGKVKDEFLNGVRATTEYLDRHPTLKSNVGTGFAFMRGLQAFPKFIYPSIHGATAAEKAFILQTLDGLPLKDVNTVKSLFVVDAIPGASGTAYHAHVTNVVKLSREQISIRPEWFKEVVIHEVGHTKDYDSAWFGEWRRNSDHGPFGHSPHVSDYAMTNEREDYAESYANYHMRPERLQEKAPEKFDLVREHEKQNFIESLMDREEFRETGKWIGDQLGTHEYLRIGANVIYWASGGIQMLKGFDSLRQASETGDSKKHYEGILDVTAGTLFASKLVAFGGLAVQGAHRALNAGVARGEITGADGDAAVRLLSDPVERGIRFLGDKLDLMDAFKPLPAGTAQHGVRAAGIAVGGAVGGIAGGMAGPYAGVLAGYHLAGPVGGACGLVVGALAGYALGSTLGGRAGGAAVRAFGG